MTKLEKFLLKDQYDYKSLGKAITRVDLETYYCRFDSEETGLPMEIWVHDGRCGMEGVLFFRSNYRNPRERFATPFLIREGIPFCECFDIQDDVDILAEWVKENKVALGHLATHKISWRDFLETKNVQRFLKKAPAGALKTEMSREFSTSETSLPMSVWLDDNGSIFDDLMVFYFAYRCGSGKLGIYTKAPVPANATAAQIGRARVNYTFTSEHGKKKANFVGVDFIYKPTSTDLTPEDEKKLVDWIKKHLETLLKIKAKEISIEQLVI